MTLRELWQLFKKQPLFFMSLIFGMSAVLAIGPHAQMYAVGILTSQEASIYSSAYANNLVLYPPLGSWIIETWTPLFVCQAAFIVLYSIQTASARSIFVNGWVATFLVISVSDISIDTALGSITFGRAVENLVSNFFGGPIVSAVLLLIVYSCELVSSFLNDHPFLSKGAKPCVPLLVGLTCLLGAYYLFALFYNPTTSDISLSAAAPTGSSFSGADLRWPTAPVRQDLSGRLFNLFSSQTPAPKSLDWTGESENAEIRWTKDSTNTFDVTVNAFSGCGKEKQRLQRVKGNGIEFADIQQLAIRLDDGLVSLNFGSGKEASGYFEVDDGDYGMFWLNESDADNNLKVTTFLTTDSKMAYWNPTGDLHFEISPMLVVSKKPSARVITLLIDGEKESFTFSPNLNLKWSDELDCQPLHLSTSTGAHEFKTGLTAGIAVTIHPRDTSIGGSSNRALQDRAAISGMGGWLTADKIPKDEVSELFDAGRVGMITFNEGVVSLEINGSPVNISDNDEVVLHHGQLNSTVSDQGEIQVDGSASAVYVNRDRLNLTRWERLDWPARLAIFGGLPGLILWLSNVLFSLIRRNPRMSMLTTF